MITLQELLERGYMTKFNDELSPVEDYEIEIDGEIIDFFIVKNSELRAKWGIVKRVKIDMLLDLKVYFVQRSEVLL